MASEIDNDPAHGLPDGQLLTDHLEALVESIHLPVDRARLREVGRRAWGEPRPAWTALISERATELGLRAVEQTLTPTELAAVDAEDLPLAGESHDGMPVLLLERRGGKLLARGGKTPPEWVAPELVVARLCGDQRSSVRMVSAEPALPLTGGHDHHEGDHGGHHGDGHARVRSLLALERSDFAAVLLYAVFIGLATLVVPVAVQAVVNTVAFGTLVQPLVVLTIAVLGALSLSGLLRALQTRLVERLQERLFVRAAVEFAHRLPRVRAEAFAGVYPPEKVNRFFDILTAQKALAALLLDGSLLLLQALVGAVLMAFYHPFLLAFDVVLIFTVVVLVWGFGRRGLATSLDESAAKHDLVAWLQDVSRSPVAFRLNPQAALERTDDLARRYLVARRQHFSVVFRQTVGGITLQVLASAALLATGGLLVMNGQLAVGQLVAAEIVVATVLAGIAKLGKHLESYYDLATAMEKVGSVTDLELERDDAVRAPATSQGPASLRVTDLAFAHPQGGEVLRGLSLEVAPGARMAVLGSHGAGKSALADVLFGLREPQSGGVLLDGVDTRELSLRELRGHLALVRGVELFSGTVFDNVALWRPRVSASDVHAALEAVGLSEAVSRLPHGVKTALQPGGAPLSGWQAQRLMLARALAGRPRLLLVDGLLDGLDAASLEDFEQRLAAVCAGRTTLLVLTALPEVAAWCDGAVRLEQGVASPVTEVS